MTGSSHPPRRPLATFLRKGTPTAAPVGDSPATGEPGAGEVEAGAAPAETMTAASVDAQANDMAGLAPDVTAPDAPAAVDDAAGAADTHGAHPPPPEAVARAFHAMDGARATDPGAPSQPDTRHTAPQAPSFMLPVAHQPAPRWHWGLIAALSAALLVQIAVADRARLSADAGTRPWVSALCTVLRCSLPPWHDPAAFTMLSREIRPATDQPGALLGKASFRNDARWPQAWPQLKLALSDADGRTIGSNVFMPEEYLGRPPADAPLLDPGQSAQVSFRVREPAAATVAFTFDFQ